MKSLKIQSLMVEFEDGSEAGEGSEAEAEDGSEAEEPEARAGPAENAETVLGKRASKPTYKVAHQERQVILQ